MALPKAIACVVILLVICYSLENQGYKRSLNVFFEGLMGTKTSNIHTREKREATLNSTDYVLEAVLNISDLKDLQMFLNKLNLSLWINSTVEITSIDTTTVCSPSMAGYQCRCEESFAWPYNTCTTYEACDAITGDTCGCIDSLPADGQYCQLNTSQPVPTTPTPSPTPTNDSLDIDIVLDLRILVSSTPSNFIDIFRETLANFRLPYTITQSLKITNITFTTRCYPNNGGLQCQCEEQFAWSREKCSIFGACSNTTGQTCRCINGLPADGEFCEPITEITTTTTPVITTTTMAMTTTTPMTTTTTATMAMTTTKPMTTTTTMAMTTTTPMTTTTTTTTMAMTTTTPMTTRTRTMAMITTTPVMTTTTTTMTTTTPMTTTTTTAMTTTTPVTTTTTTMTTTIAKTKTTPMTTTTTAKTTTTLTAMTTIEVRNLSFAMDIDFEPSYNNPTSEVYKNTENTIQTQCQAHISTLERAELIRLRPGSTIADYTIRAISFPESEIAAVKSGIVKELGDKYPILFDSETHLKFTPQQVFFGESVTVTCGPPPKNLNFSTDWNAEWRRNGNLILPDAGHSFSKNGDGTATLTVSKFFGTDEGVYECKLIDKSVFRERSNGKFSLTVEPLIQVTPVRKSVNCQVGKQVPLKCSVNKPYEVEFEGIPAGTGPEITYNFQISNCAARELKFTCQDKDNTEFKKEVTLMLFTGTPVCVDPEVYGDGLVGDTAVGPCKENEVGEKIAVCKSNGTWEVRQNNCILQPVQELLEQSQVLTNNSLPEFLDELSNVTVDFTEEVVQSPVNINAIVNILSNVAIISSGVQLNQTLMEDILLTAGVLTTDEAKGSWDEINNNDTASVSSALLLSLETVTSHLISDSFDIDTPSILLNKTTFTDSFNADLNSSVEIDIPESDGGQQAKSITVITFASMHNVLPPRDEDNSTSLDINGRVVLVQSNGTVNNVSFTFDVRDDTLGNPQCVFWNFNLFNGLGGWDDEGCELVYSVNKTVTCNCNHLTSFSILMSPYSPNDPILDYITYIGVGISMASLVICLIIEAVIWRKIRRNNTSYLRHVSIVNIAVSLLIANIWFIIGAAISDPKGGNPPACTAATFFIHFFYLALFFWMLASALLLIYRTVSVFDGGLSKTSMLAIGFSLGYGAPLIIAIITIAVTAPRQAYTRGIGICWLNWDESKALLAFVIPALSIVVINLLILLVVIYKMLRRRAVGDAAQAAERHVLLVIARSLAVLTPFFGLTWSLGVGTMTNPYNRGIHIAFAFFNSLQGFFILVFGTLLDKKVRSEIAVKSQASGSRTRSTSAGISSSSGLAFFRKWRKGKDGYNLSSSATSGSHSFTNT